MTEIDHLRSELATARQALEGMTQERDHWRDLHAVTSQNAGELFMEAFRARQALGALRGLVEQWRRQGDEAGKFNAPFGGKAIGRGVAGIFCRCADELAAALSALTKDDDVLRASEPSDVGERQDLREVPDMKGSQR